MNEISCYSQVRLRQQIHTFRTELASNNVTW